MCWGHSEARLSPETTVPGRRSLSPAMVRSALAALAPRSRSRSSGCRRGEGGADQAPVRGLTETLAPTPSTQDAGGPQIRPGWAQGVHGARGCLGLPNWEQQLRSQAQGPGPALQRERKRKRKRTGRGAPPQPFPATAALQVRLGRNRNRNRNSPRAKECPSHARPCPSPCPSASAHLVSAAARSPAGGRGAGVGGSGPSEADCASHLPPPCTDVPSWL